MRKAILYSILAISINAYAQNKQPTLKNEHLFSGPREEFRKSFKSREGNLRNISFGLNLGKSVKQKETKASSFTPIYDDVYMWKRDIPGNKWVYDNRTINLVYDVNSNLLSSVTQIWNGSGWGNDQQVTYSYTANKLTDELWQKWNGISWVNDYNYITAYDANSNISLELAELWNGSSWENDFQSLYSYDSNNNQINFTQQLWDGSNWGNSYQEISTYNADKYLTIKLSQFWDGSAWRNGFRDNYTYDTGNKLISVLEESFSASDVWENYRQSTFTYDTNNNMTNELMQTWNGGGWENYSNYIYTYDDSHNQKNKIGQLWDGASWVQSVLSTNTFDINNFVESETNRNWTNAVLSSGDSTYYHLHTVVTGINDLNTETLSLFPNPGYGKFTIKSNRTIDKIEIYNLSGEKVYSDLKSKQQNSFETDISYCAKGIYLLKVYIGKGILNKKVIIK